MLEKTSGRVRRGSKTKTRVRVVEDGRVRVRPDTLATEEPMEIRLLAGQTTQTVAVTMRTPGADFELAAGLLRRGGEACRAAGRGRTAQRDGPARRVGAPGGQAAPLG